MPRKRWCLKVPKEVYTDDFRNEVEVPRSIMETGDRTQKMLHWKEGVATESLTVRLTIADGEGLAMLEMKWRVFQRWETV